MRHSTTWQQNLEHSTISSPADGIRATSALIPGLTVLWHPDVRRIGAVVALPALVSDRTIDLSRLTPSFTQPDTSETLPLADPHLSRQPIRLVPGEQGGVQVLRGRWPARLEVGGKPLETVHDISASDLERGIILLLANRVVLLLHALNPIVQPETQRFDLIGNSLAMQRLRQEIRQVSQLSVSVLLRGETGSGKELVAQAIHRASPRHGQPYCVVNMAAIPRELASAELFGAARGAFTGADRRRIGYFERAAGGTLFLDEIGETPIEIQALLLRALENGEIQSVGSEMPQRLDVRVLAATDVDLEAASAAGRFRAPLLHRLKSFELKVPSLRERRDDIGRLLIHFLRQELTSLDRSELLEDPGPHGQPWLGAPLVACLAACDWPGNIRQLRNIVRHLVITGHPLPEARLDPQIELELSAPQGDPPLPQPTVNVPEAPQRPIKRRRVYRQPNEIDDDELLATLRKNRWRLQPAAAELGVSRTSLYKLIDGCSQIRRAADLDRLKIESCLRGCGGDLDAAVENLQVSRHALLLRMRELGLEPIDPFH